MAFTYLSGWNFNWLGNLTGWTPEEGIAVNERCVKAEAVSDQSVLSKRFGFFFRVCADCSEEVAWDPLQFAVDVEFIDNAFDLLHGQLSSAPESLCLLLADARSQFLKPGVGHEGDMSGCMGGFSRANAFQVDHRYTAARLLQKISGSDTGDAGSHHENVNFDIAAE